MFSGYFVPPDSKETKLESSDQEVSPSACRNTGVVLVPCHAWKCVPTAISGSIRYFGDPWVSFFMADVFLVRAKKTTSRIRVP